MVLNSRACRCGVLGAALATAAGSAFGTGGSLRAGPVEWPSDISFQDGRTFSQISKPDSRGIVSTGDPEDRGPFAACYAPGTSPEVMAQVEAAMRAGYQSRYQVQARWNGSAGNIQALTYSFVPDGLSLPGGNVAGEVASNSQLFSRMDSLFATQGGRARWTDLFAQCFQRWQDLTGLSYTRVRNAAGEDWDDGAVWGSAGGTNRGDLRIAMHPIDGVNNVLAYNQFPQNGDMVIDSSEGWNASGGNWLFLRNVVMHEHGHGLGFAHVCPIANTKLMEPFLSTSFDGPQQDDMRAGQFNYGDNYEPNNSSGAATLFVSPAGTPMAPGQSVTLGNMTAPAVANATQLAIENQNAQDWFIFNVADPRLVDITVTPFGLQYAQYPQDSQCNNNTINANSLTGCDLRIDVYKTNGTTIYRTANDTTAGSAEAISGLLSGTGNNYIKVTAVSGSFVAVQDYKITLNVRATALTPNASDGTFTDKVRITWPTIPDATSYQVYRNTTNLTAGGTTLATITPPTTTYDDTTAVPGTVYYYFVKAQQPGDATYRFTTDSGDPGRRNIAPVANAGPDQTVIDADNNGSEVVTLNGSASTDDGTISIYRWTEGATFLTQSSSPTTTVTLPLGDHTITLTAIDNGSATSTDDVVIHVVPPASGCGSADFNGDGDIGTDQDIEAFFRCLSGDCCATCDPNGADFNADGDIGTDQDIEAFFRVLAGGNC